MKTRILSLAFIAFLLTTLQSCELAGGIFKAGYMTGIIVVILVIALIIFIISRATKK